MSLLSMRVRLPPRHDAPSRPAMRGSMNVVDSFEWLQATGVEVDSQLLEESALDVVGAAVVVERHLPGVGQAEDAVPFARLRHPRRLPLRAQVPAFATVCPCAFLSVYGLHAAGAFLCLGARGKGE